MAWNLLLFNCLCGSVVVIPILFPYFSKELQVVNDLILFIMSFERREECHHIRFAWRFPDQRPCGPGRTPAMLR